MPKRTYKIQGYHGGISSDTDPRDIQDIESPSLVDASIDSVGRIKTLGSVSTDASASNTLQILPNRGLFVMDSDKKLDGSDGNETFLVAYDDNQSGIDIKDSDGWDTNQITAGTFDSDLPVFYVGDGNLRVGDGEFDNAIKNKWFGYIKTPRFDGLLADSEGASSDTVGWVAENQPIEAPIAGNCLISTPFPGSDSNGVNSSSSEYIGNVADVSGEDVADIASVNLRVGLQYTELLANTYDVWTTTTSHTLSDDATYYPFIADNNVKADAPGGNAAAAVIVDNGQEYTIDDENVFIIGFYIVSAEYANLREVIINHNTADDGTGGQASFRWNKDEIEPDCWNLLVCSASGMVAGDYTLGDDLLRWYFYAKSSASTVRSTFWLSGPVTARNVPLTGYPPGLYSFYHSYLYDDEKQESLPFLFTDTGSGNVNKLNIVGDSVLLNFDSYINPFNNAGTPAYTISKRITGSRLYYKLQENDNFYLIGELDFVDKGFKWFPEGDTMSYSMANVTGDGSPGGDAFYKTCVIVKGITPDSANTIDTFKTINGYGGVTKSIDAKFKTAVVHGRRTYIGNIRQPSGSTGENFPDRMLKSQINKFDIFPDKMGSVDVTINDGESIVKLEAFADRILQFKEKTMYVINVSETVDFLEDTHENKGCAFDYHVTKTDYGIAWFNSFGVYFYDGRQVTNLLEKSGIRLISESDWGTFIKDGTDDTDMSSAHIGYIPKKRQLLINNENKDVFIYDFVLRAWMKGSSKITINTNMTNFALDGNQDLVYLSNTDSDVMTWNPDAAASSGFVYQTKDIDFGEPGVRKKIYKVYVTYKTGATTNVQVKYDTNGTTTFDKVFQNGTNFTSNVLDNAGSGEWVQATLKPNTSSEANNIYSFALKFSATGTGAEVTRVKCVADSSDSLDGKYFDIYGAGGKTGVWIDVDNSGTSAPSGSGSYAQAIEVTEIETNDSAESVAIAVAEAVGDHANFTTRVEGDTVIITDAASASRTNASDGDTGFTISIDREGGTSSVPATFEINDISIVYRMKSIR